MSSRMYQVREVARIAGISVRALHHYDSIGLLVPSSRTPAGYRLYSADDLLRLQQILIGRELGLPLEDVRSFLDPTVDRRALLMRQREQLLYRARNTEAMIRSIDAALAILDAPQTTEESAVDFRKIFDGFDPGEYEAEARARWGHTDAFKESERRTRKYTEADWRDIKAEGDAIMKDAAAALRAGNRPQDAATMDVAERHRRMIDRWFYPCSPATHAALADLYEADERFARNIDGYASGLTPFWSEAVRANAARMRSRD